MLVLEFESTSRGKAAISDTCWIIFTRFPLQIHFPKSVRQPHPREFARILLQTLSNWCEPACFSCAAGSTVYRVCHELCQFCKQLLINNYKLGR